MKKRRILKFLLVVIIFAAGMCFQAWGVAEFRCIEYNIPGGEGYKANVREMADQSVIEGDRYFEQEKYEKALESYRHAQYLKPTREGCLKEGLTYQKLQNQKQALQNFTTAIKLDPEYAEAYYRRGILYSQQKQYEDAIADYTQALKLNPNADWNVKCYIYRGRAYEFLQEYEKAKADYKQILQVAN